MDKESINVAWKEDWNKWTRRCVTTSIVFLSFFLTIQIWASFSISWLYIIDGVIDAVCLFGLIKKSRTAAIGAAVYQLTSIIIKIANEGSAAYLIYCGFCFYVFATIGLFKFYKRLERERKEKEEGMEKAVALTKKTLCHKYCPRCGTNIMPQTKFCRKCGANIEDIK